MPHLTKSITILGVVENKYLLELFLRCDVHVDRVAEYIRVLLHELVRTSGSGAEKMSDKEIEQIAFASKLHDIGKAVIDEDFVYRKATLYPMEKRLLESHGPLGARLIRENFPMENVLELKQYAINIAQYHHERWDGKGYPEKHWGEDIPFEARVASLANEYDLLRTGAGGKEPMAHKDAAAKILRMSGKAFDPAVAAAFAGVQARFDAVFCENKNSFMN